MSFPSNNHNLEIGVKAIYNIIIMAQMQNETWLAAVAALLFPAVQ